MKFITNKQAVLRKNFVFIVLLAVGIFALSSFNPASGVETKAGTILQAPGSFNSSKKVLLVRMILLMIFLTVFSVKNDRTILSSGASDRDSSLTKMVIL